MPRRDRSFPAAASGQLQPGALDEQDDALAQADTAPIPVIIDTAPPPSDRPGAASPPAPGLSPLQQPQQPQQPQEPQQPSAQVQPPARPASRQAKLEQIKDLYDTAEAIGADALDRHFDQLSEMQRSLIREYFEQARVRSRPGVLGDDGTAGGRPALP